MLYKKFSIIGSVSKLWASQMLMNSKLTVSYSPKSDEKSPHIFKNILIFFKKMDIFHLFKVEKKAKVCMQYKKQVWCWGIWDLKRNKNQKTAGGMLWSAGNTTWPGQWGHKHSSFQKVTNISETTYALYTMDLMLP